VLGSGSENVAGLSAEDVGHLAEGGRLVVLGDASQALRLIGSWQVEAPETIGLNTFGRYASDDTTVLVLEGVAVTPDEVLTFLAPIAYWDFNETQGNVVADSAGTPQHGTFFARHHPDLDDAGPPTSVAPFGAETGADFHRTTKEYIAVAHDEVFELDSGTFQFWFNPDHTWGKQTLVSKDHSGFGNGGHLNIALDGGRLKVRLQSGGESFYILTDTLISRGNWYHLAFTFGTDGMKLYLNGTLFGENSFPGGMQLNLEPLVIGGSLRSHHADRHDLSRLKISQPFNGRIDEVAVYGRALDAAQILKLISAGPLGVID
jgi:hypothetical protein